MATSIAGPAAPRTTSPAVVAVVAAVALAVLGGCGTSTTKTAGRTPTTAPVTVTSSPPPSSTSPTTVAAATTTAPRATTTTAAPSPEAFAKALYDAWSKADRAAAAKVAEPAAVTAIFAQTWQAADGWSFVDCTGAAGSVICTWQRPAGQQLLMRVQNSTGGGPVTVAEVRFQP